MQKYVLKSFINFTFRTKIRSSSIIEVVVALSICMIIFFISMTVILNCRKSNDIRLRQEAQLILSTFNENLIQNDSVFVSKKFFLETIIHECDTIPGIYQINFCIFNLANQKLGMKTIWTTSEHLKITNN
jgi:hypothetical protein